MGNQGSIVAHILSFVSGNGGAHLQSHLLGGRVGTATTSPSLHSAFKAYQRFIERAYLKNINKKTQVNQTRMIFLLFLLHRVKFSKQENKEATHANDQEICPFSQCLLSCFPCLYFYHPSLAPHGLSPG